MKVVYAVTQGAYSDYQIIAIFATKEMAEEVVSAGGGDSVQGFELYNSLPERIIWYQRGLTRRYENNGTTPAYQEFDQKFVDWPWDISANPKQRPIYKENGKQGFRVHGLDKDLVDKAFQDRLAMWKEKHNLV
jgi:hypothetical protein